MKFTRFAAPFSFLIALLLIITCDYHGDLVDPDQSIDPYFTLKGQLSSDIPKTSFSASNTPRLALIPLNDLLSSEAMREDGAYQKYVQKTYSDTTVQRYRSIEFEGEFPFKFKSIFNELPDKKTLYTYRSPSNKLYQIGIFAIALFDDVNKDSLITMSSQMVSKGVYEYTNGSDTLIGIAPDHFIIYLEQGNFTSELNSFIAEKIGSSAQWTGISGGYNLVTFNSTIESDSTPVWGVRGLSTETEISIKPYKILPDTHYYSQPSVFLAPYKLFYFQRVYATSDAAFRYLKINTASSNVHFTSDFAGEKFKTQNAGSLLLDKGDSTLIRVAFSFNGIADLGYYSPDMKKLLSEGNSFSSYMFKINSRPIAGRHGLSPFDTLVVDSDIVRIELRPDLAQNSGGDPVPVYVNDLFMRVSVADNAPWTLITTNGN